MPARTVTIRPLADADFEALLSLIAPDPASPLTAESYREKFAARQYRSEWTWLAVDDADDASGDPLAVAVWWGPPAESEPGALDAICVHDSIPAEERIDLAAAVLRAGHESFAAAVLRAGHESLAAAVLRAGHESFAAASGSDELPAYHVFVPGDWREQLAVVTALSWRTEAARRAGLTELLERLRFEWTPAAGIPEPSQRLTFHAEPDDDVFVDLFRRVLAGSLDNTSVREAAEIGPEAQARADVAFYRDVMLGERSWWRVAKDADGTTVGFGIPSRNPGAYVVGYLGVLPEHRGKGYGDDILGEITRILALEAGAEAIRSDTDLTNTPMAAAMERLGYGNFARRLVFSARM